MAGVPVCQILSTSHGHNSCSFIEQIYLFGTILYFQNRCFYSLTDRLLTTFRPIGPENAPVTGHLVREVHLRVAENQTVVKASSARVPPQIIVSTRISRIFGLNILIFSPVSQCPR